MALGDAYVAKNKGTCYLSLNHGYKQKEYVLYKKKLLEMLTHTTYKEIPPRGGKNPNIEISLTTRTHPLYKRLHELFYVNGRRTVRKGILNWLTDEGIAIWYMDDGALTKSRKTLKNGKRIISNRTMWLHTCAFPIDEQMMIIDFFKKRYGIEFKLQKQSTFGEKVYYSLRCNAGNANKFFEIIAPYVVPSMAYKLDMEYSMSYVGSRNAKIQSDLRGNTERQAEMTCPC